MNDKSADAKLFERKDVWHHMVSLSYNELEMWLHVANNILQIFFFFQIFHLLEFIVSILSNHRRLFCYPTDSYHSFG